MRIGFISTRLAGTDGVSLETAKIAGILRSLGHEIFYCAGELDPNPPPGHMAPLLHFDHPEIKWLHDAAFASRRQPAAFQERLDRASAQIKAEIAHFAGRFGITHLFVQNALAIPMNIPLGMALTDFLEESGLPAIAHNHDLYWERERFLINCIPEILERCFPPTFPHLRHLVINSIAREELLRRTGNKSRLLPNIFDFAKPPPGEDAYNLDLRAQIGLERDDLFILQPTRVVARKGIEFAIELASRLHGQRASLAGRRPVLVISHYAGDEGLGYLNKIRSQAKSAGVPLIYAADRFAPERTTLDGKKIYSLWDAYVQADFVTYPSLIEGFGNALIETIYFNLPALVNRYPVYKADIGPLGFDLVEIDGAIDDTAVSETVAVLSNPDRRKQMTGRNYQLALKYFSYQAVRPILAEVLGPDETT